MNTGNFYYPIPANEPVLSFAPGSPERERVKNAIKELKSNKIDIPMYIGAEEVRTGKKWKCIRPMKKIIY